MYVPVILGTAREGRYSDKVASFVLGEAAKAGLESEILDVREYRIIATDKTLAYPEAKRFAGKMARADALIIVSPEYNHGYPGELKMMLDMLYEQYARKPVGFCGVSMGGLGGARCVEKLRLIVAELHMVSIREAMYFSGVRELFDEKGVIKDAAYYARAKTFLDELMWYAQALNKAREK
ncbi:MAG: NAD(P)H-dependent oxidoreductase [Candidatus Altiarchaeia archaeon]